MNLIASPTPQTPQRQSAINLPWPPEAQVLGMEGMDTSPGEADNISPQEIYAHLKRSLLKHPAAEGIYLLGSGAWRVVDVVPVEDDLEVLVVHPVAARVWYVQKQMRIRQPVPGADRLLAVLP
jgi:maleate cis-trans isomerase